jgi:hypothetical protein
MEYYEDIGGPKLADDFYAELRLAFQKVPKVLPETPTRSTQPNRRRAGARALSRCV